MGIHVSLPNEMEEMVHAKVQTGMYGSASEVVRSALRAFFAEDSNNNLDISDNDFLAFFGPMIEESEAVSDDDLISWDELQAGKEKIRKEYLNDER